MPGPQLAFNSKSAPDEMLDENVFEAYSSVLKNGCGDLSVESTLQPKVLQSAKVELKD